MSSELLSLIVGVNSVSDKLSEMALLALFVAPGLDLEVHMQQGFSLPHDSMQRDHLLSEKC